MKCSVEKRGALNAFSGIVPNTIVEDDLDRCLILLVAARYRDRPRVG
jgi:hypothetical protein